MNSVKQQPHGWISTCSFSGIRSESFIFSIELTSFLFPFAKVCIFYTYSIFRIFLDIDYLEVSEPLSV